MSICRKNTQKTIIIGESCEPYRMRLCCLSSRSHMNDCLVESLKYQTVTLPVDERLGKTTGTCISYAMVSHQDMTFCEIEISFGSNDQGQFRGVLAVRQHSLVYLTVSLMAQHLNSSICQQFLQMKSIGYIHFISCIDSSTRYFVFLCLAFLFGHEIVNQQSQSSQKPVTRKLQHTQEITDISNWIG
jgi:hypothetical protein